MKYTHENPLVTIFQAINDYTTMKEEPGEPTTPSQLIDIGITIITNDNIFASDTRKWNDRDTAKNTQTLFKIHFYRDQKYTNISQLQQNLSNLGFQ